MRGNVFFNDPRAGVNLILMMDLVVGNVVIGNLLFNYVRETGDHGPFNLWDSQPFVLPNFSLQQNQSQFCN